MVEHEPKKSEESQPHSIYSIPRRTQVSEPEDDYHESFPSRAWSSLRRKKYVVGAGIVLGGPVAVGLAQGLSPQDALVYGALQIATIGAATSPKSELVHHMMHALYSGDTKTALEDFHSVEDSMLDSYKELLGHAGVVGAAGAVIYNRLHATSNRREAVVEGLSVIKPKGEQVIILGGQHSYVADMLATQEDRRHFLPVFETAAGAQEILASNTRRVQNFDPIYLNLDLSERRGLSYLVTPAWERLKLSRENLIHASNGKRYLMVVGCGEKADEELSRRPENIDVSQDDLRSAAIRLRGQLQPGDLVEDRDVIDVYVGNAAMERINIENQQVISDRDLADSTGVDIYVDTWAHVLRNLAEKIADGGSNEVSLATSKQRYHDLFNDHFSQHLSRFQDCEEVGFVTPTEASEQGIWLVYEGTSEETFMAARRLRKKHPEKRIVALLSSDKLVQYTTHEGLDNVEFISAAAVIAEAIRFIRDQLREGKTPDEIQALLDEYAPTVDARSDKRC